MSIEIANSMHAVCTFFGGAGITSAMIRADGFEAAIVRSGAGAYTLRLAADPGGLQQVGTPPTALNYAAQVNILPMAGLFGAIVAHAYVDPTDGRNVFVRALDPAGVAADGTYMQVMLFRLPTIG